MAELTRLWGMALTNRPGVPRPVGHACARQILRSRDLQMYKLRRGVSDVNAIGQTEESIARSPFQGQSWAPRAAVSATPTELSAHRSVAGEVRA
jgi:hypothetical protein